MKQERINGQHLQRYLIRSFVFAILSLIALAAPCFAQDSATTATLYGTVRDGTGASIPGATITLRNLTTNQIRTATTESAGSYRIPAVTVGDYELKAEAAGFAPYLNSKVTLALGQSSSLDISLPAAGVTAQVTVDDKPPALDATQTAVTTAIDPERIEELPVNSRNYLEFTLLAPGVAPSNQPNSGSGGAASGSPLADSGFTFGGLRARSNSISIDGLDNADETTGAARIALSPEIIREFQIVNNGQSAEFGGAAGGAINVVTRVGENQFHGDVFTFFASERFNAREPFSDPPPAKRLRFRRVQPGVALGGPIKRDRVFFYAAAEQEHLSAEDEAEIPASTRARINSLLASGVAPRLALRSLTSGRFSVGSDETEAAGTVTYIATERHTLNFRFAFTNLRERSDGFNTDTLTDGSARGSVYTKDSQWTTSAVTVLSAKLVNDFRFQFSRRRVLARAGDTAGPGVEIVGLARFGRPFDADATRCETREQVVDNLSLLNGRSEWKGGATLNHVALENDARDGFGGLFIFQTVDDFSHGRPAVWRQAFGASATKLAVTSTGAFLQDQWRATPALSFNLGIRYDIERLPTPFPTDKNNFSPRLGVAWSPAKEWVVRAGFGLFYDRLPLAFLNRAVQKNGVQSFEQIASDQAAPNIFAATAGGRAVNPIAGIAPSIFRTDPKLVTPHSRQINAGVERLLSRDLTLRADYLFTRGIDLPRIRNINLLAPVILTAANAAALGVSSPSAQQFGRPVFGPGRSDPRFDTIYQVEDSANSTYNGLTLALKKRLSHEFELLASYTLSKTTDDASDFDEQPQNPFNLSAERALSRQDVRQRFVVSSLFDLPFGEEEESNAAKKNKDDLLAEVLGHIEIAPIVTISSGRPVNPLTGSDEERSGAFPLTSRPLGLARNSLHTQDFINVDIRALKYFPFGERRRLDLVIEAFNLFNHPNVFGLNSFYGSAATPLATFRMPTSFAAPRQMRFSIDFEF